MKKISIILYSCVLSGCANFSEAIVHGMDALGAEDPTGISQLEKENTKKNPRLGTPVIKVEKDFPEGEFSEKYPNGNIKFKTYVQNGCFDKFVDIYYPNGQLRTHTPLVNCQANGLSQGYLVNGALRTEIPYVDSYVQGEIKVFDKNGNVAETKMYHQGYPVSTDNK